MDKDKFKNSQGLCQNIFKCLGCQNLTDDDRKRLLIFLTECAAAILKVDAKISVG
ncbi:MAG: hypothetical protein ACOX4L_07910 [Bacillota bacterium]|jgi:hypothetical protein